MRRRHRVDSPVVTSMTAGSLTLIEKFEHLDDLAETLLHLKADLSAREWQEFCRGPFQKRIRATLETKASLLSSWERALPSAQARRTANSLFAFEIREIVRMLPRARILALGDTRLHPIDFGGAEQAQFACDRHIDEIFLRDACKCFDFIYTADWLHDSSDARAVAWLSAAAGLLAGGGRLLGANLMPGAADSAYLEARWNVWPVYRDEQDLANLASRLTDDKLRGHAVFRDDGASVTFLEIQAS